MISASQLDAGYSTIYSAAGNQYNVNINSPQSDHTFLQPFNDAPTDLLSTRFTGRQRELDFLRDAFSATSRSVPIRCVAYGMPGLGKTSLVLQYAVESFDQGLYSQVLWSSGTTVDKLNEGMVKILDLVGHPERHRPEQGAKLTAARRWLEDSQGDDNIRWLLIIDNVDRKTLGFLREHLPRRNARGSILITTRTADVADALVNVTGSSHQKLEMGVPCMRDTTRLFFSSAGIETDTVTSTQESEAEKLIEAVGSLPLAIVHAASYMKQTQTSLEDMLQLYQNEYKGEMLRWMNDLTSYQEQSVTATFEALFAELDRDSSVVSSFMKLLSFLDSEKIPLKMLVDGAKGWSQLDPPSPVLSSPHIETRQPNSPTSHPIPETRNFTPMSSSFVNLILSPVQLTTTIQKLQSLSLVERLVHNGQPSLRIHDLVQYIISEHAKQEDTYLEWLRSAVSLVCRAFDLVEDPELPQWWPECEKLMPHLHSLNERWSGVDGVSLDLAKADVQIARYLISRGRYAEAGDICERGFASYEKEYGTEHQDTLDALHILARAYYKQERYPEAEAAAERVWTERNKTLGADHQGTVDSMHTLALVYTKQGRLSEAEERLERVVAGFENTLGADHRDTFKAMNDLANVYYRQERYDDTEKLLKRTLASKEKNLGRDDVDTLITVHHLARVYKAQKRYAESEELYKHTLLAREQQLGPNHPRTLTTISNLARLYQSQGRHSEAEQYFKRVFTGRMQQLGASHPGTSRIGKEFAEFYLSQGRESEAEAVLDAMRDG